MCQKFHVCISLLASNQLDFSLSHDTKFWVCAYYLSDRIFFWKNGVCNIYTLLWHIGYAYACYLKCRIPTQINKSNKFLFQSNTVGLPKAKCHIAVWISSFHVVMRILPHAHKNTKTASKILSVSNFPSAEFRTSMTSWMHNSTLLQLNEYVHEWVQH